MPENLLELLRIGYVNQGFSFTYAAPNTKLPRVRMDQERLKQCILNLVKNSMEAMPGGGEITLLSGISGEYVYLEVKDRGCGMNESQMEKAFNPFFTTKEQGYGLGLAMIKKIVEEEGGKVGISSTEGQGTTVRICLRPEIPVCEATIIRS